MQENAFYRQKCRQNVAGMSLSIDKGKSLGRVGVNRPRFLIWHSAPKWGGRSYPPFSNLSTPVFYFFSLTLKQKISSSIHDQKNLQNP